MTRAWPLAHGDQEFQWLTEMIIFPSRKSHKRHGHTLSSQHRLKARDYCNKPVLDILEVALCGF